MKISAALLWLALFLASPAAEASEPGRWTLSVDLHGRRLEGFPLRSDERLISLLLRDGRMEEFSPTELSSFKKVSSSFRPFSAAEMRAEILHDVGNKLEVTGTGHYVVAHPKGRGAVWSQRFEELYRSMVHYFTVRGLKVREPEFPLAAIVWGGREDFLRYAAEEGSRLPSGVIGYYSSQSNRITLYDVAEGAQNHDAWQQNASTVVHEAAHQTAFNTGLHRRFAATPTWIAEGLGTLFEARGVWDSDRYPRLDDRINRERLANFREYLRAGRPPQGFLLLVADDRQFQVNPMAAYAEAWALTFYLVEKEPRKYAQLLAKTAALEPFGTYTQAQRLADFRAIFGDNPRLFDANFLRFIETLK